jgi:hypothetical protein
MPIDAVTAVAEPPAGPKIGKRELKLIDAVMAAKANGEVFTRPSVTAQRLVAEGLLKAVPVKATKHNKRTNVSASITLTSYQHTAAATAYVKDIAKKAAAAAKAAAKKAA